MDIDKANRTAVERMTSARPCLPASPERRRHPDLADNLLLHAGPPSLERASGHYAVRDRALLFEGAQERSRAVALVERARFAWSLSSPRRGRPMAASSLLHAGLRHRDTVHNTAPSRTSTKARQGLRYGASAMSAGEAALDERRPGVRARRGAGSRRRHRPPRLVAEALHMATRSQPQQGGSLSSSSSWRRTSLNPKPAPTTSRGPEVPGDNPLSVLNP